MRKILSLILCAAMMLTLVGSVSAETAAAYTAGTYTASANGNNGPVTVTVTFSDTAITDIQVGENSETEALCAKPFADIPAAILANQSLAVDTVSGATNSSNAVLNAVADCVAQAGGDVDALKNVAIAAAEKADDVDATYDVVIIGGGGAGLSAALSATEQGASVVIIEKMATLGGNSLIAGGGFNACDPERQSQQDMPASLVEELRTYLTYDPADFGEFAGVLTTVQGQINEYLAGDTSKLFDTPEMHALQCYIGSKRTGLDGTVIEPDLALVTTLTSNAMDALNWAGSYGVEWNDTTSTILGAMWPRSHGMANGKITTLFEEKARAAGVVILTETAGKEFIVENGAVTGVKAEGVTGNTVTLHANKGVVLATGGFAWNAAMVVEYNNYWEGLSDTMPSTNAPGITGDGIVMAQAIGAELTGMGFAQLMPSSHPVDGSLFTGVWGSAETQMFVNKEGKRYVNEYAERDVLSKAALEQTDGLFFIIADKKIADLYADRMETLENTGCIYVADTLEELAEKMGVPVDTFVAEVEKYNEYTLNQNDPDFGKTMFGEPIDTAPFVATPRSPSLHHTMGGVKIDTDTHVIDTNGNVIAGLYAAGEVCGGIHAGNRLGGNAMTDFLVFGRIAGANASQAK